MVMRLRGLLWLLALAGFKGLFCCFLVYFKFVRALRDILIIGDIRVIAGVTVVNVIILYSNWGALILLYC